MCGAERVLSTTHLLDLELVLEVSKPVVQLGECVDLLLVLPGNFDAVGLVFRCKLWRQFRSKPLNSPSSSFLGFECAERVEGRAQARPIERHRTRLTRSLISTCGSYSVLPFKFPPPSASSRHVASAWESGLIEELRSSNNTNHPPRT